jgi:ApaG protein
MKRYEFSISVKTQYIEDQSSPDDGRFVFGYTITIRNSGQAAAQLISRHWLVSDADDHIQEVHGLGVVGHQPLLKPGESFEYSSGTAIATPNGSMRGEYFFVAEDGTRFETPIPEFSLTVPRTLH